MKNQKNRAVKNGLTSDFNAFVSLCEKHLPETGLGEVDRALFIRRITDAWNEVICKW